VVLAGKGHMKIVIQRQLADLCVMRLQIQLRLIAGAPAAPNTSAARSCNCRVHSVIWFG
jgi:hypothetical protein